MELDGVPYLVLHDPDHGEVVDILLVSSVPVLCHDDPWTYLLVIIAVRIEEEPAQVVLVVVLLTIINHYVLNVEQELVGLQGAYMIEMEEVEPVVEYIQLAQVEGLLFQILE